MKNARDYLAYMQEHPEERELISALDSAEREQHIKELGFEFTLAELQEEMECGVELSEEDLDAMSGGISIGVYTPWGDQEIYNSDDDPNYPY